MSEDDIVLRAKNLSHSYGDLHALRDLDLELRAGEIIGLLGPNGAGKTTAIRVLTTILPPTKGSFEIMGISDDPGAMRAVIGVLPESNGFPPGMTGVEYLVYIGRLYGAARDDATTKARELLTLVGLEKRGETRIRTYSRGMRQRLGIARALVNEPRVLFLDEPTLGFDPIGQREMLDIIRKAAEEKGVAAIICSHLLDVVEQLCSRIIVLHQGKTIASGPIGEIKNKIAIPSTCWLEVEPSKRDEAISLLEDTDGVTVDSSGDEELLLVLSAGTKLSATLRHLLENEIEVVSFHRERTNLGDAFVSLFDEVEA